MSIKKTSSTSKPWRVDYYDNNGVRHRPSFKTRKEAVAYEREQLEKLASGTWVDPAIAKKTTVGEVHKKWFHRISTVGARGRKPAAPKTLESYGYTWSSRIKERWEHTPLDMVNYRAVSDWMDAMDAKPATKQAVMNVFGGVMREAVRLRLIPQDPTRDANGARDYVPERQQVERVYLSMDQLVKLSKAFTAPYDLMVMVAGTCGLRWGEMVALLPDDFTPGKTPSIRVSKSISVSAGERHTKEPKNGEARTVPVPRLVSAGLEKHIRDMKHGPTIFRSQRGKELWDSNFRKLIWKPALDQVRASDDAFPVLTFHELRHTAVSLAIKGGANIKVVQSIAGHRSASMTLDVYGHLFMDDLHDSAARLNESLKKTGWSY